ncbi:MAG: hypothetical protein KDL87_12930 [Verrucomicrobiae bacterium]|nr:hypothetical protein [Verrucomicrobiae bacterium]
MNAPPKEWSVLFNAATDGTIDDEGAEALATLLRENAEARRQWYLHCDVELGLAEMGAMRGGPKAISKTPRRRKLAALLIPVAAVVALGFFLAPRDNKRQPVQISVLRTVDTSSQWTAGSRISVERLELETGELTFSPASGVTVTATAPVALELINPMHLRIDHGKVTAEAVPGFTIDTSHAKLVDLGTQFGVEVVPDGDTRLVVFDGEVEVHSPGERARTPLATITEGRSLRIGSEGRLSALPSVTLGPTLGNWSIDPPSGEHAIIRRVTDNVSAEPGSHYYPLFPGGLAEGVRAFPYQNRCPRWWSPKPGGLPSWLKGADFVQTLQRELNNPDLEISVEITRPCDLFIFHESEVAPPEWLEDEFTLTGAELVLSPEPPPAVLPGDRSIQPLRIYSVWKRHISSPGIVKLGPVERLTHISPPHYMYGIAAKPAGPDTER